MSNSELQQRKQKAIARGEGNSYQVYVKRAKNAELWDVEGKRYIDFGSGIAVVNTGHCHPKITAAVKEQVESFSHTCLMVTPYESAVTLAEGINAALPGPTPKKTIFVTTGGEAVENAVKIARSYTGRSGVISFNGSFHGRTLLTMGLTGKVQPYKAGFGPFPAELYRIPYPNALLGITEAQSLEALHQLFKCDIDPERVAAIIIECVQGEGGFYPAPVSFLKTLRALCDEKGILLICDEIQTGFARTGRMFAHEYAGIEPDLVTMAKGLGGGYPIAAVAGKAEIMDHPQPGGLGGTYAGSPLGCTAGVAVLDVIQEEQLCARAEAIGERMVKHLQDLQARHPALVGDIRHLGAMIALELVEAGDINQPNAALTKAICAEAAEQGLLLLSCGTRGNVIRFLPPLTIEMEVLDEGAAILAKVFDALAQ
jgi:4-aminobutyrate aminotransferase / (S)-3-amino-2-methylpropionate transaminase / 5-aminovalerate transaminase